MKNFARCHPVTNFIYYISAIIFGMILRHPVFLCISFFSAFFYNAKLSGKKAIKSFFCFLLPIILAAAVINGLTAHYGVTELFSLPNGNRICLEPIVYGLVSGVSASGVIMLFFCYNQTVGSDKLYYMLGKFLPKTALLLTMSLRFFPLYSQKLREIAEVQKGLGKGMDSGNIFEKLKNGGRMVSVLVTWALENSIETADSMKSRGYGMKNRSHYADYHFSHTDIVVTAVILLCDLLVVIGVVLGETFVLYNPFFKTPEITLFSVFIYLAYAVLLLTPLLLDCKVDMLWKKTEGSVPGIKG